MLAKFEFWKKFDKTCMFVLDIFNYKQQKALSIKFYKYYNIISDIKLRIEAKVWFKKYKEVVKVFTFYKYKFFFKEIIICNIL